MTRDLPPLPWLRAFEAAARHASFAAAADELGLTPAAISQQIRALESELGFPLFERLPRGVRPTDIALAWLPAVRRGFDEIRLATAGLFGTPGGRVVTLRAPISFARLCVAPRLAEFRDRAPGVRLRLCTAIWADALDDAEVDVEIRYGDGRWPGLHAEPLAAGPSVVVRAPGFGPGDGLSGLIRRGVIHIMGCEDLWTKLARQEGLGDLAVPSLISADTSLIALELAAAGLGAALVLEDFALPYLADGRLVLGHGARLASTQGHFVTLPQGERASSAPALALRDWLVASFAA